MTSDTSQMHEIALFPTEPLKGHFLMIIIKKQAVFQINNNYL